MAAGEEEAQLAFAGATAGLSRRRSSTDDGRGNCTCLVVDLGGHSTELAVGECEPTAHRHTDARSSSAASWVCAHLDVC
jgi:exopolyphosphatase/pppGpp-phosphohydrolase